MKLDGCMCPVVCGAGVLCSWFVWSMKIDYENRSCAAGLCGVGVALD
jgi:hypothetical protein